MASEEPELDLRANKLVIFLLIVIIFTYFTLNFTAANRLLLFSLTSLIERQKLEELKEKKYSHNLGSKTQIMAILQSD